MKKELLQDSGELAMIRRVCRGLPRRKDVAVGPGDDCAVVRLSRDGDHDWLLKSDPVIEGVHFASTTPGRAVGHKALARALSDIAAMGGEPLWALTDIVAPAHTSSARIAQAMQGVASLARRFRVAVVGGDTSAGPAVELHVFVVGRVEKGRAILRSGAKPGDALYVTGTLGGSLAGKHLRFEPRLREGRWLGRNGWAHAMIDLSDGLATDLRHLIRRSRVGAELWLDAIPLSVAVRRLSGSTAAECRGYRHEEAIRHALTDGEDFELLFAVPASKTRAFQTAWQRNFSLACVRIGTVTRRRGVIEMVAARGKRKPLEESGYEHYLSPSRKVRKGIHQAIS